MKAGEEESKRHLCNGRDSKLVVEAGLAEEEVGVGGGVIVTGENVVGGVDVASYQSVHVVLGWVVMEVGWGEVIVRRCRRSLEGR